MCRRRSCLGERRLVAQAPEVGDGDGVFGFVLGHVGASGAPGAHARREAGLERSARGRVEVAAQRAVVEAPTGPAVHRHPALDRGVTERAGDAHAGLSVEVAKASQAGIHPRGVGLDPVPNERLGAPQAPGHEGLGAHGIAFKHRAPKATPRGAGARALAVPEWGRIGRERARGGGGGDGDGAGVPRGKGVPAVVVEAVVGQPQPGVGVVVVLQRGL